MTRITELIPQGHENSIGRRYLISKCVDSGLIPIECKDKERVLRTLIHEARKEEVICNAGDGFFLPTLDDKEYLKHDISRKKTMALQILVSIKQSKKLLADYEAGRIK